MIRMARYVALLSVFDTNIDYDYFGSLSVQSFLGRFSSTLDLVERGSIPPNHELSQFTEFAIVHNAEEAANFPDNVFVVWPNEELIDSLFAGIYWALNRTEHQLLTEWDGAAARPVLALEDFGLTYPLTAADLVDNWRKVDELWFSLTRGEQSVITSHIRRGVPLPDSTDNNNE